MLLALLHHVVGGEIPPNMIYMNYKLYKSILNPSWTKLNSFNSDSPPPHQKITHQNQKTQPIQPKRRVRKFKDLAFSIVSNGSIRLKPVQKLRIVFGCRDDKRVETKQPALPPTNKKKCELKSYFSNHGDNQYVGDNFFEAAFGELGHLFLKNSKPWTKKHFLSHPIVLVNRDSLQEFAQAVPGQVGAEVSRGIYLLYIYVHRSQRKNLPIYRLRAGRPTRAMPKPIFLCAPASSGCVWWWRFGGGWLCFRGVSVVVM